MTALEQMLANNPTVSTVKGGPTITHEQHDTNQVHVEEDAINSALNGLGSIPEWDAGEYGITREEARRRLELAKTPTARATVIAELKRLALNRAGLDNSTGKVALFVVGKMPWHRLGVTVAEAVDSANAMALSSTDWPVNVEQGYYYHDGQLKKSPESYMVVRGDTGAQIGKCGTGYKPLQNRELFAFTDEVLKEFGARYESAGSLYGGRRVFLVVRLPQQSFKVNKCDLVEAYAVFTNPHDGGCSEFFTTAARIECANTHRVALKNRDAERVIKIRHTGSIRDKIADARRLLGLSVEKLDEYADACKEMAVTKVKPQKFFNQFLDEVTPITEADAKKGPEVLAKMIADADERKAAERRIAREIEDRKSLMQELITLSENEKNGIDGMRGTAWNAFNSVTEWADHGHLRQHGTQESKDSRRFESVLYGDRDQIKQTAFQLATAL